MTYSVETLTAKHAVEWLRLRLEGTQDHPLEFLITAEAEEASETSNERATEILRLGGMRGVFLEGELVGFAGFRRQQLARIRHRAEIGPFYVTSRHHGTGAARELISAIVREAKIAGVEQLELHVDAANKRAIRFYEKVGFEWVATHPDSVRIDGVSRADHF